MLYLIFLGHSVCVFVCMYVCVLKTLTFWTKVTGLMELGSHVNVTLWLARFWFILVTLVTHRHLVLTASCKASSTFLVSFSSNPCEQASGYGSNWGTLARVTLWCIPKALQPTVPQYLPPKQVKALLSFCLKLRARPIKIVQAQVRHLKAIRVPAAWRLPWQDKGDHGMDQATGVSTPNKTTSVQYQTHLAQA